jgi:hypothetical protein
MKPSERLSRIAEHQREGRYVDALEEANLLLHEVARRGAELDSLHVGREMPHEVRIFLNDVHLINRGLRGAD